MQIAGQNKKAKRDYNILQTFEAGIVLYGDEVKSLRSKSCSLQDSFARVEGEEAYLYNMHIPEFGQSSYFKSEPKRRRKLLLHKKEIKKLMGRTTQQGLTIVPLKVYLNKRGLVKVEIALAKGRHTYDKRRKLKEKAEKREAQREMKDFNR
ncbi:MAG: SsrA-binding protein SmpB [Candidatus Omnitrophica bacterium]|nr:SsrA-binding protein SmpB [Candidatus Omnitrophota bacterium]MCF7891505.1 SsrA-binding protein SmpB [Candidatus Omnitrophota bacterium]MCF7896082.1 SsrA-binding protein SmpB [Candidatus Omnitrophota bacterium]MCF7897383.1 SsrA-binding protein SmpB [Candidatus Omnitrophota bacterium]MCF7909510.1 SsrA-binding protein SmpB [Candidatus Omnitrophota bacterium]